MHCLDTFDINVNTLSGLDAFNATSFMPPLLDWQLEGVDLNAALSAAIKEMGDQLLLLRPAAFKNPFESTSASVGAKTTYLHQDAAECHTAPSAQTASGDFWQPRNPWSATQYDPELPSTRGHVARAAALSPRCLGDSAQNSERTAAAGEDDAPVAGDKVFACVQKRVVIATRELVADKMRRLLPPQWLQPCVAITAFVFKMCELEPQRRLRKEFLQSDMRLLLYAVYTR